MSVNSYADHYFIFGDVDTRDYGIVVSNDNGFDSPERDVEEIEIPGRNGTLLLDNGRYKNQVLTYNCILRSDFADQMDAFRAAVCAQFGYQRIEDSFHPDIYRMGRVRGEIKAKAGSRYENGTFDVDFDVKPQKFLKSGETSIAVASGNTISNPTMYNASPMLEISGHGTINLGSMDLTIYDSVMGTVIVGDGGEVAGTSWNIIPNLDAINTGDAFQVNDLELTIDFISLSGGFNPAHVHVTASTFDSESITFKEGAWAQTYRVASLRTTVEEIILEKGTDATGTMSVTISMGTTHYATVTLGYAYASGAIAFSLTVTFSPAGPYTVDATSARWKNVTGYSTVSMNSLVLIDLEIGNAWTVVGSKVFPLNNSTLLPAELPTIPPGTMTITYSDTITDFKITPRWWTI